jgi:hypothetical protein
LVIQQAGVPAIDRVSGERPFRLDAQPATGGTRGTRGADEKNLQTGQDFTCDPREVIGTMYPSSSLIDGDKRQIREQV